MSNILTLLKANPIIPVLTIQQIADAVPLAQALSAAGINVVEVTLRTACAMDAMRAMKQALPQMLIGAGTVRNDQQLTSCKEAGLDFAVSPGFTENLLQKAKALNFPYLPGVATNTEILMCLENGYEILKFFPAELHGGTKALKLFQSLYPEIIFCPTGGIQADNLAEYLTLKNVISVGGSWITPTDLLQEKAWDKITALAKTSLTRASATKHK